MNTITKGLTLAIALFCIISTNAIAQNVKTNNEIIIQAAGNKTSFKANEQVILKASGYDQEKDYVQWQVSTDEKNWFDVPRATGELYETYPVQKNQYFRVVTRPNEGYLSMETKSRAVVVALDENVAMRPKKGNN